MSELVVKKHACANMQKNTPGRLPLAWALGHSTWLARPTDASEPVLARSFRTQTFSRFFKGYLRCYVLAALCKTLAHVGQGIDADIGLRVLCDSTLAEHGKTRFECSPYASLMAEHLPWHGSSMRDWISLSSALRLDCAKLPMVATVTLGREPRN